MVKDYAEYSSDGDPSAGLTKLNTEIISGNAPDLIANDMTMPLRQYAAKGLLEACGCDAKEIGTDAMQNLPVRVKSRGTKALCEALGVGEPTLMDIVSELCKPGRDVRDSLPKPLLRSDVMGLEDLKPGMELKGTVRNVIDFGAFVDIGVHQDGLVHVSQISDKFIKNPRDALKVGDVVQVKVLSVDTAKKRIALTMKGVPQS